MAKFTEAEIDSILASVDQVLAKAGELNKAAAPMERPPTSGQLPGQASAGGGPKTPSGASMAQPSGDPMKKPIAPEAPKASGVDMAQKPDPMKQPVRKDDMDPSAKKPEEGAAPAPAGAEAPAAPTDDAPAIGAEGGEGAAPAAPAEGQAGLEGEQGGDAPLSDDELHEIYASMDPAELERHFMIIRSLLQGAYGEAGQEGAAPAPAPEAAPPAPPAEAQKSEGQVNQKFAKLEAENSELRKSLEKVVSAMEVAFTPTRKAVTDIEYIRKGEELGGEVKELSKDEIHNILNEKSKSTALTKADRDAINDFILNGGSRQRVLEIVKGGK